jgi:hypothetical protein
MGRKIKNTIKNYQNYVYECNHKGKMLLETLAVVHRPQGFTEHNWNATSLEKLQASELDDLKFGLCKR